MRVTYAPPLMEQIRGNYKCVELGMQRPFCVFIRACSSYVMQVNPKTQKTTERPQQFIRTDGNSLAIVPEYQWSAQPGVIEVDTFSLG